MVFNSFEFAIFLPIVLVAYYSLNLHWQNRLLLAASFFFYGWWDYRFLFLLCLSMTIDYTVGHAINNSKERSARKRWIWASICANLSILGFFKYFNFFYDSATSLLHYMGFEVEPMVLRIVLPVGISFYTFQSISYTIDIYRGQLEPCRDFLTFATYVSYFPQLVAGPIERATHLLPQISAPRYVTSKQITEGAFLMLVGLFKKVGVADSIAPIVDARFASPEQYHGAELLFVSYLFAAQIYCDFSGYTDIARGTSKLLGIELMKNFSQPYFATSISDFWRKWHISLSTWLRDYLYIPLGGNRHGELCTYRNLFLTMLIGGIWHGANWTFVFWGTLHGAFLAVSRWIGWDQFVVNSIPKQIVGGLLTFHMVCFAWIFFRADNFDTAFRYVNGILDWSAFFDSKQQPWFSGRIAVLLVGLTLLDVGQAVFRNEFFVFRLPAVARGIIYGLIVVVTLALGGIDANIPFIYFQF